MNRIWIAFVVGAGVIFAGSTALAQEGATVAMAFSEAHESPIR